MISLSQETEALAKRLAEAQHLSIEDAVRQALEERGARHGRVAATEPPHRPRDVSPEAIAARSANIDRLVAEIAAMPILDPRSPQEIMDDLNDP